MHPPAPPKEIVVAVVELAVAACVAVEDVREDRVDFTARARGGVPPGRRGGVHALGDAGAVLGSRKAHLIVREN